MAHEVPAFQSFVGVDLHKCTVTLKAVNPAGEVSACLTISTKSVEKIEEWLRTGVAGGRSLPVRISAKGRSRSPSATNSEPSERVKNIPV